VYGPSRRRRGPVLRHPALASVRRRVTTIEGLSPNRSHPVQRAWLEEQVPQCGYCHPAKSERGDLLARVPNPADSISTRRWPAISAAGGRTRVSESHSPCGFAREQGVTALCRYLIVTSSARPALLLAAETRMNPFAPFVKSRPSCIPSLPQLPCSGQSPAARRRESCPHDGVERGSDGRGALICSVQPATRIKIL